MSQDSEKQSPQAKPIRAWKPRIRAGHVMEAITAVERLNLKSGDKVPADTPFVTLRSLYRKRQIGYLGHDWTKQQQSRYKDGDKLNDFVFYADAATARANRIPRPEWPSAVAYKEAVAEIEKAKSEPVKDEKEVEPKDSVAAEPVKKAPAKKKPAAKPAVKGGKK